MQFSLVVLKLCSEHLSPDQNGNWRGEEPQQKDYSVSDLTQEQAKTNREQETSDSCRSEHCKHCSFLLLKFRKTGTFFALIKASMKSRETQQIRTQFVGSYTLLKNYAT